LAVRLDRPFTVGASLSRLPTIDCLRALDADWIELLRGLGFALERSDRAWVSYDGAGTVQVAPDDALDDDDFLGQILLHELCHWFVQGPDARDRADWGLDNTCDRDREAEHAALRLQAHVVDRHGLRAVFVATTDFRPYWEALPVDPLRDPSLTRPVDEAIGPRDGDGRWAVAQALAAWERLRGTPVLDRIDALLARTPRADAPTSREAGPSTVGPAHDTPMPLGSPTQTPHLERTCSQNF
jgi:hypothetical protein